MSRKEDKAIEARVWKAKELAKELGGDLGLATCVVLGSMNMDQAKLEKALAFMNALMASTDDGLTVEEFPEACDKASAKFGVKYEDLADAYDEQYAEQEAKDWAESCAQMKQAEGIWEDNGCYWPASGA